MVAFKKPCSGVLMFSVHVNTGEGEQALEMHAEVNRVGVVPDVPESFHGCTESLQKHCISVGGLQQNMMGYL